MDGENDRLAANLKNERNANMNRPKAISNPKKNRRILREAASRVLSVEEIVSLHNQVLVAGAPVIAERFIQLRGAVTVGEASVLLRLAALEIEARRHGYRD